MYVQNAKQSESRMSKQKKIRKISRDDSIRFATVFSDVHCTINCNSLLLVVALSCHVYCDTTQALQSCDIHLDALEQSAS